MERMFKGLAMLVALGIAYEAGRERGAREMFFKWTEACLELKSKENKDGSED